MADRREGGGSPPNARVVRMIETESIEDENGVPFLVIYGISGNTHRFWSLTNASRRAAARAVTPAPTTTQSAVRWPFRRLAGAGGGSIAYHPGA